jgi:predicted NUDIX family NTP pyrophosphohydrolase
MSAMKLSCGTLLYRKTDSGLEVLLVHPSGWYNRDKPWSIPKGVPDAGESHEAAARRETWEETGVTPGELISLGHCDYQKSGKRIYCFAGPLGDAEPKCASWEIDQAKLVSLDEGRRLLHPDQRVFIDRLEEYLAAQP